MYFIKFICPVYGCGDRTGRTELEQTITCPIVSSGVLQVKQTISAVLLTTVTALGCGLLEAQEKARLPGQDWISLFDGKDLGGWTKIGQESWTVEDGLIHGKGLTKDYGYLQTEKPYKDFQLSLRFKCVADGNSGVFFHTAFKPGTADVTQGMQFEIDCTMMHHTGGVYAEDG